MSAVARNQVFSAIHTVGALLPADMLVRISEGKDVSGAAPSDYRVVGRRSVRDDAERHWEFLKKLWTELRERLPLAPEHDLPGDATGHGINDWLLPLFDELGFGALTVLGAAGITSDDGTKTFPISHRWNHVPIHLTAWNVSLDRRPAAGAVPAQSLVQECLNRTDAHLWGVISNGRQLRLLRDSSALATSSYVEFDLEAIFDGELFSEFVLLYRLLHVTRFAVAEGAAPSTCWLEKWRLEAITAGTRALEQLRDEVRDAITTLGTGFLKHPDNAQLREHLDVRAFHTALLRLVYRLLFVFVAEDRDLLHPPETDELAQQRYADYFSTARLRAHARRRRGTDHDDLYQALRIVLDALGDENGRPELGLPGLGGVFDDTDADAPLRGLSLTNEHLLSAVRHLAQVRDAGTRRWRSVDYQHLGAEELGSIYESLLEQVPRHSRVDRTFELAELPGNDRKTTGSYYTPSSLIDCLLDTTLDPVLDDAVKRGEQQATATGQPDPGDAIVAELLSLTVCDPACGSGHFLVAAARRIAKRVAAVRERNPEPTAPAVRDALHDVIARCIYGVDNNPMALDLAKVSLWLEAMRPGRALSFLDAHLKCGNSLIGATPALVEGGIPDEAFKPIEGDDKKFARALAARNKAEREAFRLQGEQGSLFDVESTPRISNAGFAQRVQRLMLAEAGGLRDVHRQAERYGEFIASREYLHERHIADAWCAAFLWPKAKDEPDAITDKVFRELRPIDGDAAPQATHDEIDRLRDRYQFFHWHLEFPEIFRVDSNTDTTTAPGWDGGFTCVLGNPPWEHLELKEQEFFFTRAPEIATATGAARKRLIEALPHTDGKLFDLYADAKRQVDGQRHLASDSGLFPLCGRGRIKTDTVFAEQSRKILGPNGHMGMIVPSGIATDATTQYFFRDLVDKYSIIALYDFENSKPIFPDVHRSYKFCVLSLNGIRLRTPSAQFAFFMIDPSDLEDPNRVFTLTPEEISLLNPNTKTCPIFRSRRDAEVTLAIYRRVPVLLRKPDEPNPHGTNPWGVSFMQGLFNMTTDSHLFRTREQLEEDEWRLDGNVFTRDGKRMLPLYEAKMVHHYDHRWATYTEDGTTRDLTLAEKQDPNAVVLPRYWVPEDDVPTDRFDKDGHRIVDAGVSSRLAEKHWDHDWLIGFRKICRSTDERTLISLLFPKSGLGDSGNLAFPIVRESPLFLYATASSLVIDYILRQKLGGTNLNFFQFEQLPALPPEQLSTHGPFIHRRILELAYTASDMTAFAEDLGERNAPFIWSEERRITIRAELDALFFHLYGISRDDVEYIMETFPIVRRKDEAKYGSYRTKVLILAEYDRMAEAGVSLDTPLVDGENYLSTLNPPPGHGPRHPQAVQ